MSGLTLYRFYDAGDRLLYVGVTKTGLQRVRGHASASAWWPAVARATFEHGRTLADERTAIELERPLFNVEHTDRSDWVDAVQDAVSEQWTTDQAKIRRWHQETRALRDQLAAQLAECERRLVLITEADRVNRRARS